MGETDFAQNQTSQACRETIDEYERIANEALRVQTPGGVFEVQWNNEGKATAMGQLCPPVQRWYALARYIADKILAFVPDTPLP